jgi:hypothetical protein
VSSAVARRAGGGLVRLADGTTIDRAEAGAQRSPDRARRDMIRAMHKLPWPALVALLPDALMAYYTAQIEESGLPEAEVARG